MKFLIGYVVKLNGRYFKGALPHKSGVELWVSRDEAKVFPSKAEAEEEFTRPGFYGRGTGNSWYKMVTLIQRRVKGPGRFVVRWRDGNGLLSDYLDPFGCWQCRSMAKVFDSWDAAERCIRDIQNSGCWFDGELGCPAIVKLRAA